MGKREPAIGSSSGKGGRGAEGGYALLAAMLILAVMTGLVIATQATSRAEMRIGANQYGATQAFYAAEAGAEKYLAAVREEMADGFLNAEGVANASANPPTVPGFTFTDYEAELDPEVTVVPITQGPFAGLLSLSQDLTVRSSVEGQSGLRATVEIVARALSIPIFQFAAFYEDDLEIFPGPQMDLKGRVHTNSELYADADGPNLRFWDVVTVAGDYHKHRKAGVGSSQDNVRIRKNDGSWVKVQVDSHDFGLSGHDGGKTLPSGAQDEAFDDYSKANWDHKLQTRASGIEPLRLPIPDWIEPREIIQPCTGGEGTALALIKYACRADLVIEVKGQVVVVTDGNGLPVTTLDEDAVAFQPNQFYDHREQTSNSGNATNGNNQNSNRDVIDIDLSEFDEADYPANGVIYVTADSLGPGGVLTPKHFRQYVVRIREGEELKASLTVATNLPLYIQGRFNRDDNKWQPASVASDAITLLSRAWDDGDSYSGTSGSAIGSRVANDTEYQVAILSGHSPTPFHGSPNPGGQLENYPRFLENWSGRTATINGSFVSLWFSEIADSQWSCCQPIYRPPQRDWNFDDRFLDLENLPPATPAVGQVLRLGFLRRY